jgi:DMSO/TMAO reductase YedYZ heme-binding membrane subunit
VFGDLERIRVTDPHLWWHVARASGLVAWAAMTGSVLWGVLLATRVLRSIDNPAWLQDLHRWLGGTALIMTGLHMLSLMLNTWAPFSLAEVLVPLAAGYRPLPVTLGIAAFYLLVAVYGTSLLRPRMPRQFWKALHFGSYVAVLLVSFHAGWSGTDVGSWGYRLVAFILLGLTTVAVLVRVLTSTGAATIPASRPLPPPTPRTMTVTATYQLARDILWNRPDIRRRRGLAVLDAGCPCDRASTQRIAALQLTLRRSGRARPIPDRRAQGTELPRRERAGCTPPRPPA